LRVETASELSGAKRKTKASKRTKARMVCPPPPPPTIRAYYLQSLVRDGGRAHLMAFGIPRSKIEVRGVRIRKAGVLGSAIVGMVRSFGHGKWRPIQYIVLLPPLAGSETRIGVGDESLERCMTDSMAESGLEASLLHCTF